MQKLQLDLAELHVETFTVTPSPDDGRGTVRAHWSYLDSECENITCYYETDYPSFPRTEGCSAYCEPGTGPGWSQWCPEEEAQP
jgi:hypothetical protein